MRQRIPLPALAVILAGAALAAVLLGPAPARAQSALTAKQADAALQSAAAEQAGAQAEAERWTRESEELSAEERELAIREEWLGYQVAKHEAYIAREREAIEALRQRREAFAVVRRELEPLLDSLLERLELAVADDLPFLPRERAARLDALRAALDDYELPLQEKLRRTLEALRVEAGYGGQVEVTDEAVVLGGAQARARVLRLGRLGLYCLLPDGRGGMFDAQSGTWQELSGERGAQVAEALEITARRQVVDLVSLPVQGGRP
jgi:hypothetical protein